jgi:hypothetical protein
MLTSVFLQIKKRFSKTTALCKQCHEKEANMRVANPKAYLVFYDNFLKIAAGQALLCLENNEQDWLQEAKILRGAE